MRVSVWFPSSSTKVVRHYEQRRVRIAVSHNWREQPLSYVTCQGAITCEMAIYHQQSRKVWLKPSVVNWLLLKLRVLRFGLLIDRNLRVRVFPRAAQRLSRSSYTRALQPTVPFDRPEARHGNQVHRYAASRHDRVHPRHAAQREQMEKGEGHQVSSLGGSFIITPLTAIGGCDATHERRGGSLSISPYHSQSGPLITCVTAIIARQAGNRSS